MNRRKTATEIIDIIVVEGNIYDDETILDVLEDGETLKDMGITDEDKEAVEEAHDIILNRIGWGNLK